MASEKPEAVHAPSRYSGALMVSGGRHRGDVPVFSAASITQSPSASVRCLYLAPLMMKAFDDKFGGTDKLVIAEIPVDLRPLLPTLTTRYFHLALSIRCLFSGIPRSAGMTRYSGARRRFEGSDAARTAALSCKAAADRCVNCCIEADMPLAEKNGRRHRRSRLILCSRTAFSLPMSAGSPCRKAAVRMYRLRRNPAVCCAAVCAADPRRMEIK